MNTYKKHQKSGKRGTFLMTISLLMILALVAGIGTFFLHKGWKEAERSTMEPQLFLGEKQLKLLLTSIRAESDLFYLDQVAKYSASDSILELADGGGFIDRPDCGEFVGYHILKDEDKFCEMDTALDNNFNSIMNRNYQLYAMSYSEDLPANFEYSLLQKDRGLNVIGVTDDHMNYDIGLGKKERTKGVISNRCHYCGKKRDYAEENFDADKIDKGGNFLSSDFCWEAPCPSDAQGAGFYRVNYFNQCGQSETTDSEKGCGYQNTQCYAGCGPTVANMIIEYFGVPSDFWYFFNWDYFECYNSDGYSRQQLVEFFSSKGVKAEEKQLSSWEDLIAETRNGPVILHQSQEEAGLCDVPKEEHERNYCTGGHYLVILYADEDYVIVNDPYSDYQVTKPFGHNLVLSKPRVEEAWKARDLRVVTTSEGSFNIEERDYRNVLIRNDNSNIFEYYPLDSTSRSHTTVNTAYSEIFCSPSGSNEMHPGVVFGADVGDNIYAVADGVVLSTQNDETAEDKRDDVIIIQHKDGYTSRYYFASKIVVEEGEKVFAGEKIGEVGNYVESGIETPTFYFEIHHDGDSNGYDKGDCMDWLVEPISTAVDPLQFYLDTEDTFTTDLKFSEKVLDQVGLDRLDYVDYIEENIR